MPISGKPEIGAGVSKDEGTFIAPLRALPRASRRAFQALLSMRERVAVVY